MVEGRIRFASLGDAAAVRDIYAHYVLDTTITFEEAVPTVEEMRERIAENCACYPYLVYEEGGEVVGYAYAYRQMKRAAYRFGVTTAIYLRDGRQGGGRGRRLYGRLLGLLARQGVWNAYALIALPNAPSLGLHKRFGFIQAGYFERIGYKMGKWLDVVCLAKCLRDGDDEPSELLSVGELRLLGFVD